MRLSQPARGRKSLTSTGILLTVLVSVSFVGALATQWVEPHVETATPTPSPGASRSPQGVVPGTTLTSTSTPTLEPGVVLRRDFGLWGYVARKVGSGLSVDPHYLHGTLRDLEDYVALNKERAGKLALAGGMVDTLITFRWPLEPDLFRRWVLERRLDATLSSLRLQTLTGARGTLTVAGRNDDPLPQDALDKLNSNSVPIAGVYSVRGKVPAGQLAAITSDPIVFVADVTPTLARLDLADAKVPGAHEATISAESPFTEMEEFGLVKPAP